MNITILDHLPPLQLDILIFIKSLFTLFTVLKVIEIFTLSIRKTTKKPLPKIANPTVKFALIQKEPSTKILPPLIKARVSGKFSDDEEETSSSIGEGQNSQQTRQKNQEDFEPVG